MDEQGENSFPIDYKRSKISFNKSQFWDTKKETRREIKAYNDASQILEIAKCCEILVLDKRKTGAEYMMTSQLDLNCTVKTKVNEEAQGQAKTLVAAEREEVQ